MGQNGMEHAGMGQNGMEHASIGPGGAGGIDWEDDMVEVNRQTPKRHHALAVPFARPGLVSRLLSQWSVAVA
jgi:hypothetical protein